METGAFAHVARQNGPADESFNLEAVLGFGTKNASDLFEKVVRAFLANLWSWFGVHREGDE